jgi:hypothetical protein
MIEINDSLERTKLFNHYHSREASIDILNREIWRRLESPLELCPILDLLAYRAMTGARYAASIRNETSSHKDSLMLALCFVYDRTWEGGSGYTASGKCNQAARGAQIAW